MVAGVRPASGSGAGFVQQTASGSVRGPGRTHTGRSTPGFHHLDVDLRAQTGMFFGKEVSKVAQMPHVTLLLVLLGVFVSF